MFGHTIDRNIGLGYISADEQVTKEWIESGTYEVEVEVEVEVAGERVPARAYLRPVYDQDGARVGGIGEAGQELRT